MRVQDLLESSGVAYDLVPHEQAYTAQEVAAAEHVTGHMFAKTVIVRAGENDSFGTIARRVAAGDAQGGTIEALNSPVEVASGRWIRVPLHVLRPEFRALVLQELFPEDTHDGDDWIHVARAGAKDTRHRVGRAYGDTVEFPRRAVVGTDFIVTTLVADRPSRGGA